jgi:arsenate reductase
MFVTFVSRYTIGVTVVNPVVFHILWEGPMRYGLVCFALLMATGAQQPDGRTPRTPPTVLFMCPHGAAKSVLASAYFERQAKARGLNVRVESAGTDPDPTVSPAVAAHLKRQGYPVRSAAPRRVTAREFESADVVISIGCDLSQLPKPRGKLIRWDEVPPPSDDFEKADQAIRKRVDDLIQELLRSAGASHVQLSLRRRS